MGTPTWVIPVASLGAICLVGIVFIWWWFPRTWRKGTKNEMQQRFDENRVEGDSSTDELPRMDLTWHRQVVARALAKERGEDLSQFEVTAEAPRAFTQNPPAYSAV